MNRFIAALLRMTLWSLHVTVGYAADALDDTRATAVVSGSDRVAMASAPTRAVATVSARRILDLRPPALRSLHLQIRQPVDTFGDPEDVESVTIVSALLLPEDKSGEQASVAGIASLYWAARHPTQAWRVFLPVQLDGGTPADIRAACGVFARAQSDAIACR